MRRPSLLVIALGVSACTGTLVGGTPGAPRPRPTGSDAGAAGRDAATPPPRGDAGAPDASETFIPPTDTCGDTRLAAHVYYGTSAPTVLPMTPGQILAVGAWDGCSGLLIAPTWVLTAHHCGLHAGENFCMGHGPSDLSTCFAARHIYDAPSGGDLTLAEIDDATVRLPDVVPVPILVEDMTAAWVGRTAEAAGYGQQEDGGFHEREFTAEPIVDVSGDTLTVDGEGRHGLCFGDSGGPVMVLAADGTVRVAGALSNGDGSCLARDNYTRVGPYRAFIESHTGPTTVVPPGCGTTTAEGRCMDATAVWCDGATLRSDPCAGHCGWDAAASGYRCLPGADPCMGIDAAGRCDGAVARWCDAGVLRQRDCGACGQSCGTVAEVGGAYCVTTAASDPCMGLDFLGRCTGDRAEYCGMDGTFQSHDCAADGLRCMWIDDTTGYWCG